MRRRTFLACAGSAAAVSRGASGSIRIDTHTHFYDPTRPQGVPWPNPKEPSLYRPVLPAHFRQATQGLGDVRTVVVEASPWVEDNQWLLDQARDEPVVAGIVGNVRPGAPDFQANLERFARNPLFRGIRVYPQNALKDMSFDRLTDALRALAGLDLQVDLNGGAGMYADVVRIAEKLPDLRIVIEHLPYAWPRNPEQKIEAEAAFRALRARPRVWAKVTMFLGQAPGGEPEFRQAAVDEVWDLFGQDRVFYGSNWPLSDRTSTYGRQLERIDAYVRGKGPGAAEKFFLRNAVAAYGLRLR